MSDKPLTDADLAEIEQDANDEDNLDAGWAHDLRRLVAEVRRLRAIRETALARAREDEPLAERKDAVSAYFEGKITAWLAIVDIIDGVPIGTNKIGKEWE